MNVYSNIIKYIDGSVLCQTRPLVLHILQTLKACPHTCNWQVVDCYMCGMFIRGLSTLVFNCETADVMNATAVHRIYTFVNKHFQSCYIIYSQSRHASFVEFNVTNRQTVRIFANNTNLLNVSRRIQLCVQRDWKLRSRILLLLYIYRIASTARVTKACIDDMQIVVMLLQYHAVYKINDLQSSQLIDYLNKKTHESCWHTLIHTLQCIDEYCCT